MHSESNAFTALFSAFATEFRLGRSTVAVECIFGKRFLGNERIQSGIRVLCVGRHGETGVQQGFQVETSWLLWIK